MAEDDRKVTGLETKLGAIAESIASRLSNQNYMFVVLLVIVLGGFAAYLATDSATTAIAVLAVGLMGMLFGLLSHSRKPQNWKAIYTFILMLCYVVVVLVLIGYMFFSFTRVPTMAQHQESIWHELYDRKALELTEGVKVALAANHMTDAEGNRLPGVQPVQVFKAIDGYVEADPQRRYDVLQIVSALEGYERCREAACNESNIHDLFENRVVEFWASFRCVVTKIAHSPGYDDGMAELIRRRFEEVRRGTDQPRDSLAVCDSVNPLPTRHTDCSPGTADLAFAWPPRLPEAA